MIQIGMTAKQQETEKRRERLTVDSDAGSGLVHPQVADGFALVDAGHLHAGGQDRKGAGVLVHLNQCFEMNHNSYILHIDMLNV